MADDTDATAADQPSDLDQFHRYETGAKNALAKGDTAAAAYLRGIAKQHLAAHYKATDTASGELDPTSDMSTSDKFVAGMGQGITDVGRHAANLVGMESDQDLTDAKQRDKALLDTSAGNWGAIAGQTLATAPLMAVPMGAAARVGAAALKAGKAANLVSRVAMSPLARSVVESGAQGALMTDPGQSRTANAIIGGGLGAAGAGLGALGGKLAKGLSRTDAAQKLIDEGVYPTIGQLKPGGFMSSVEQMPIVKQMINIIGTKKGIQKDYMRVLAQKVSAPGTTIGRDDAQTMLDQAYRSFEPLYDQGKGILRGPGGTVISTGFPVGAVIHGPTTTTPLIKALTTGVNRTAGATAETKSAVTDWLQKNLQMHIRDAKAAGGMTATDLLKFRSNIRDQARSYGFKTDSLSEGYKRSFEAAEDKVTQALKSQLPQDAMDALNTADAQYGHYKQLEEAFRRADTHGRGEIGPTVNELTSSIGAANRGQLGGQAARGVNQSPLKELADAGRETFGEQPEMKTGHSLGLLGALATGAHSMGLGLAGGAGAGTAALAALPVLAGSKTARMIAAGATRPQRALQNMGTAVTSKLSPQRLKDLMVLREAFRQAVQRGTVAKAIGTPTIQDPSMALAAQ